MHRKFAEEGGISELKFAGLTSRYVKKVIVCGVLRYYSCAHAAAALELSKLLNKPCSVDALMKLVSLRTDTARRA